MRRVLTGIVAAMLFAPSIFAAGGQGSLQPVDLRCEFRSTPLGIDAAMPRLSWKLNAVNPSARGLSQSAYEILVASTEANLAANQADIWDSGKVGTDASTMVGYRGKTLSSGEMVWWKVRVWDGGGLPSNWSQAAHWSVGLLAASDWQGKWIGLDGGDSRSPELATAQWIGGSAASTKVLYFRRTFEVQKDKFPSDALLFMAGSGAATVTVNGKGPFKSESTKSPVSMDIHGSLQAGTNVVAVSVKATDGAPLLLGAVELDFEDGQRTIMRTGSDWKVSSDGSSDWQNADFNDASWETAHVAGDYGMAPWGEFGAAWRPTLPARMLRKEFAVQARPERATLYVSGLGLFEAYLNGQKVSNDVLVPALSEYEKRDYYMTYDVTKLLKSGNNAVGIILGDGRFFAMRRTIPTAMRTFGYPKLRLQLNIQMSDGNVQSVSSDESWKLTTEGPIRANNEYDGETYDARKEMTGWSAPGFNDSGWQAAQVVESPGGVLSSQTIAPIRVTQTLKPVAIHEVRPGVYVYDLGQNMVGWCRVHVAGPRGTTIRLRHAERLRPDGSIYVANLRSAEQTDTYTLKGGGLEAYSPRFTYHGFRYVEVTGYPGKPTLASLEGQEVHDDLQPVSEFATSNELLNRIYKAVYWGVQDNYRSVPTDCPQRDERQGWVGDRAGGSLGEMYLFGLDAFYAKWIRDMNDAQLPDGELSDTNPAYWAFYHDNVTWVSLFILVSDHLYRQYGDRGVIEQNYPAMRKWILHMQTYMKDGLMPRDSYGDWCAPPESPELIHTKDPKRITDRTLLGTSYFYHLLRTMSNFAMLLDRPGEAREYSQTAGKMLVAFNKAYLNTDGATYSNASETSSVLPLAFHMVPEEDHGKVVDALIHKIVDDNHGHVSNGLVGQQWQLQALSAAGHTDVAYGLATQKTYPSWGYMIDHGATTIWELWNGDTADPAMNSGNHLMLIGDFVTWCFENLAGIAPDDERPGFKHIIMHPTPVSDLNFVKASFDSPQGKIVSDWKVAGGHLTWNISVPPNTVATVHVPTDRADSVTESGRPPRSAPGVKEVGQKVDEVVYEIGSGNYRFEAQAAARQ